MPPNVAQAFSDSCYRLVCRRESTRPRRPSPSVLALVILIYSCGSASPTAEAAQPARAAQQSCIVAKAARNTKQRAAACAASRPAVMRLISRGVPVFAFPSSYTVATDPGNKDYGTEYHLYGNFPAGLVYDLSSVPGSHRRKVLAVFYNGSYAYNTLHTVHYNNLGSYTIDGNAAPGGGDPPKDGWRTLVSVTGNTLHSRQHMFNFKGYNWLRIYVTQSDGSPGNFGATLQFYVYDVSALKAPLDDWIFYGDSITGGAITTSPDSGVGTFSDLIHQVDPARWPVAENAGEPYDTSKDGVNHLLGSFSSKRGTGYLSIFPGRYVALCYGMNDFGPSIDAAAYYSNMQKMVKAVLAAGKIPVVPTINYTNDSGENAKNPALNAKIRQLYKKYPQIVHGPDFWSYFRQHPELVEANSIHPTGQGFAAMRQLWADAMLREVYHVKVPSR